MDDKVGLNIILNNILEKISFFRHLMGINQPTQDDSFYYDLMSQVNRLENRKKIINNLINK